MIARTAAEAKAQPFEVPQDLEHWREFASLLDGYAIAQELGFDLMKWAPEQEQRYAQARQWELDTLGLRLMLFYEFRADHFTGYTYHERDETVDSLLQALRARVDKSAG